MKKNHKSLPYGFGHHITTGFRTEDGEFIKCKSGELFGYTTATTLPQKKDEEKK